MITLVRKFSIFYNNEWLPVLYLIEHGTGERVTYCVAGGTDHDYQILVDAKEVTRIVADKD